MSRALHITRTSKRVLLVINACFVYSCWTTFLVARYLYVIRFVSPGIFYTK